MYNSALAFTFIGVNLDRNLAPNTHVGFVHHFQPTIAAVPAGMRLVPVDGTAHSRNTYPGSRQRIEVLDSAHIYHSFRRM
jgi:hypothetical protein